MRRAVDMARAGARPPKKHGDDPKAGARPAQPSSRARARIKGHTGDPLASTASPDLTPDVYVLRVRLEETGELFRVANCRSDMTVRELKEELDLMVGIPFNLQRLHFLDQGILMDDATLKFYDVIPGAIISLCIWHYDGWTELVLAAVEGDPRANCLAKSPLGRTPLHVAAAMGRTECIQPLLEHGASIHDRDLKSETPVTIARRLKRGNFERKMFILYWMIKSGTRDPDLVSRDASEKHSPGVMARKTSVLIS
ncbi:ankyrin repeat domain-containing protein 60 isoform X2 [Rattus norvegicus]|uniref:ankyrin repeat domain-containing protein 60 isoform X2 n=1 Tax=Rattus norvegicus TaxID=10116 RepID=UPI002FD845A3